MSRYESKVRPSARKTGSPSNGEDEAVSATLVYDSSAGEYNVEVVAIETSCRCDWER